MHTLIDTGAEKFLTYITPTGEAKVARNDHPAFERMLTGLEANEDITELFDVESAIASRFESLSERVKVANGRVYLDGNEVDNSLTKQIMRFYEIDEGFQPLVNFFENIAANPNDHSREQLYDWIRAHDLTITYDGLILGYKGVRSTDKEGQYHSTTRGTAIVDDETHEGFIPNYEGATVEMPRDQVHHDPSSSCSTGLHVGNYSYARGFGNTLLTVHVNPRDVVSVPSDSGGDKVRVCRYVVTGLAEDQPEARPVIDDYECGHPDCEFCEEDEAVLTSDSRRVPTPKEFSAMAGKARSQKKGVAAVARQWDFVGGDQQSRFNYRVKV